MDFHHASHFQCEAGHRLFESKPSGALHPLAPAERPWKGDVFGTSQEKAHLGWGFLSWNL